MWDDLKPQYASKAFLMHQPLGQGHVIAFAEDPNFRAFTEATSLLFINAVLLGPAHYLVAGNLTGSRGHRSSSLRWRRVGMA